MSVYPVTYYCLPITPTPVREGHKQPLRNKGIISEEFYCEADKECQREGGDYRSLFMFQEGFNSFQTENFNLSLPFYLFLFILFSFILLFINTLLINKNSTVSDVPPPPTTVFSPMVTVMTAVTAWIKDQICSVSILLLVY